jgi:hypothetical protein
VIPLNYLAVAQLVKALYVNFRTKCVISYKTLSFEMDLFSVHKEAFPRQYSSIQFPFSFSCSAQYKLLTEFQSKFQSEEADDNRKELSP